MKNLIKNVKDSWKHIPYTWMHYLAFLETEKKVLGKYKYKFHDWDKLALYIFCPYLGKKKISYLHQRYQKHHPIYIKNDKKVYKNYQKINWEEAIIDWECARITKPDKPLNARETLNKYYSEYNNIVIPILTKLGL